MATFRKFFGTKTRGGDEKWSAPRTLSACKHWRRTWMLEDTVVTSPSCSGHTVCVGDWAEEAAACLLAGGGGICVLPANSKSAPSGRKHNHCIRVTSRPMWKLIICLLVGGGPSVGVLLSSLSTHTDIWPPTNEFDEGEDCSNPTTDWCCSEAPKIWNVHLHIFSLSAPALVQDASEWIPLQKSVGGPLICAPWRLYHNSSLTGGCFLNQNMRKTAALTKDENWCGTEHLAAIHLRFCGDVVVFGGS